jgi:hypothetical protein
MVLLSEVPKSLEIGSTYSTKQIYYFLGYNDAIILCEDTPMFNEKGTVSYIVENIYETFVHRNENGNTYHIPVRKKKVYVISKN